MTAGLGWATPARAAAPALPPGLVCLERVYGGKATVVDGKWALVLGPSLVLPWDDGKVKDLDQAIDAPDLEDMFSIRYPMGEDATIRPITDPQHDPGRIRVEPLFETKYLVKDIVPVMFVGKRVQFAKHAAEALTRVGKRLEALRQSEPKTAAFFETLGGTFNQRVIAGTTRKSAHSFAIAIDLNTKLSDYWRWAPGGAKGTPKWQNKFPQSIVDAFEAEGFIWGGRWYHFDTMHFEYRPELLDPSCYAAKTK